MERINFTHNYKKLAEQKTAKLIHVEDFILNKANRDIHKDFLETDTAIVGGGNYKLKNGKYIIMTFIGDKNVEFTTIRYATPFYYGKVFDRKKWAIERIGKIFEIRIKG